MFSSSFQLSPKWLDNLIYNFFFFIFKVEISSSLAELINEKGFVHDIELVLLLKNNKIRIKELPIRWVHMDNSKLNPFSESAIFFINFFKLLIKYKLKR